MTERHSPGAMAAVLGSVAMALCCGAVTVYAVLHALLLPASVGAGSTALWVWLAVSDAARAVRDKT